MKLKTAVIIAGGKGTRLGEIANEIPKPMVLLNNKPILERIIHWLKNNGVSNIVIGVAYKKEKIKEYFGDGSKFGVKIIYTEHDENGGTEDAFKTAIEKSGIQDENFYAMNGDQITDLQLEGLTNSHIESKAIASVVTIRLRTNFGIVKTDSAGWVTEFQEKKVVPEVIMNCGIYVFNKKIKEYLTGGNIELNAFKKLITEKKLRSFFYDGMWTSVNDQKELKAAEEILKKYDGLME
ncbi:MAG TPA: nucleotidyltransferase family protein [Candidatus Nanoarchaeia archaeon]|nr:nucleotidyltransferase family protein [Candidatus Nanoarchaeia archaeon]